MQARSVAFPHGTLKPVTSGSGRSSGISRFQIYGNSFRNIEYRLEPKQSCNCAIPHYGGYCCLRLGLQFHAVVDFSFTLVKGCREVVKNGSLEGLDHLKAVALTIARICADLLNGIGSIEQDDLPEEQTLQDVAVKTTKCAQKLITMLESFSVKDKKRGISAILHIMKAMSKRKEIEELQKDLESYEGLLELSLIKRPDQKHNASIVVNSRSFTSLDNNLQDMITVMAQGRTRIADIVAKEDDVRRKHVTCTARTLIAAQDAGFKALDLRTNAGTSKMLAQQTKEATATRLLPSEESKRIISVQHNGVEQIRFI